MFELLEYRSAQLVGHWHRFQVHCLEWLRARGFDSFRALLGQGAVLPKLLHHVCSKLLQLPLHLQLHLLLLALPLLQLQPQRLDLQTKLMLAATSTADDILHLAMPAALRRCACSPACGGQWLPVQWLMWIGRPVAIPGGCGGMAQCFPLKPPPLLASQRLQMKTSRFADMRVAARSQANWQLQQLPSKTTCSRSKTHLLLLLLLVVVLLVHRLLAWQAALKPAGRLPIPARPGLHTAPDLTCQPNPWWLRTLLLDWL